MDDVLRMIDATCLCGAARHEITIPQSQFPLKVYICHCNSCRHQTGSLCLTLALLPETYQPHRVNIEKLQVYKFSRRITQHFCPTCGTTMFLRILLNPDDQSGTVMYGVPTGTLEQADGLLKVMGHEHIQDTLDGGFSDFITAVSDALLARWPGHFEEHEQLPLSWTSADRDVKPVAPTGKLHGHCKCGSINFWIARPSGRSALAKAAWPDVLIPYHSAVQLPPETECWWLRDGQTKFLAGVCACNSCRLASGMEWVAWAFVSTADISLDPDGTRPFTVDMPFLRCYRSSSKARRYFCEDCGAMILFDGDDRPMVKDIAVGLLDAPEGARAENWLEWTTERLSFREDGMERASSFTLAVEAGLKDYGARIKEASQSR